MEERNLILQKFVPKLVNSLTNFKPNQDNFKICLEFSYSHFKHHRFLSLNTHEVKRDIEGICQKFKLNHFHEEEKIIRKLFEQSLSHEISLNHSQKEVMYGIMSMLISLAYDPINKMKEKKRKGLPIFIKIQKNQPEENMVSRQMFIDSLLQDNFSVAAKNETDSDLSEWTESSEDDELLNKSTDQSEEEIRETRQLLPAKFRPPQKPNVYSKIKLDNTLKWLKDNTQNCWWNVNEVTCSELVSTHKAANFYAEWQRHLTRKSLGFIKAPPVSLLSEYCLLREIIWMYLNPVECKFFKIHNGEISARTNVCIPSTTIETLQIFLKNFISTMNIMYKLKIDIEKSLKNSSLNHTLENYFSLLQQFLDEITEFLIREEEKLKERTEIFTVITLNDKMECHSSMLKMLWDIHSSCILDEQQPSHIRSLYLIASLNYHVNHSACKEKKNLSLTFLLACLKTYFKILDVWWTEARLHDSKKEFVVEKLMIEDVEFIQPRLIAKCKEKAFYINDKISQKISEDPLISAIMCCTIEATFTLEIISKLDRIHEMKQIGDNSHSLYEEFMDSISKEIKKLASNQNAFKSTKSDEKPLDVSNNQKLLTDIGNDDDDIMYLIFNSSSESVTIEEQETQSSPLELYEILNKSTDSILLPLENSIERLLKKLLSKKIAIAEKYVMHIYFKEFQIEQSLLEVRRLYFLESNELINLLNLQLFPQMERGEKWANSYLLTILFNETVSPRDMPLFTVHVNKLMGHSTVLEAIDELTIYLNVSNNFENIFTISSITKYNEVFRFLLKIKWAQRILNCLLFPNFFRHHPPYAKFTMLDLVIKRLSLTRFSMQQAITMIHNHLMALLQSLGTEFEEKVAKTHKITDLIMYHSSFVENFHSKALLGEESRKMRSIVIELIKLSKVVANEWQNIITFYELDSTGNIVDDSISLAVLNVNTIEIEKAFKICEKQLKDLLYF